MDNMERRQFIRIAAAGAGLVAVLPARDILGAELIHGRRKRFPMRGDVKQPDAVRMLAGYLEAYRPPERSWPVDGGTAVVYDLVDFTAVPHYRKPKPGQPLSTNGILGQIALRRVPGAPSYEVRQVYSPWEGAEEELRATIQCHDDQLNSISDYDLTWSCRKTNPLITYQRSRSGHMDNGRVDGRTRSYQTSGRLTALWTMFDAVRRLPARVEQPERFAMLTDLVSLRRKQELVFDGAGEVNCAAGAVPVRFYRQLGEGITPIHYAIDERQRTLWVTQGQLGWALNRIGES